MKKLFLLFNILIIHSFLLSQTWKELNEKVYDCLNNSEYSTAFEYAGKEIQQAEKESGKKSKKYAISLSHLAELYIIMGRFTAAEPLYIEIKETMGELYGKNSHYYATSLDKLAGLYKSMGHYNLAEPLYKEALEIYSEVFGKKHIYYAISLNNAGMLYDKMGRYEEAEKLYKEAGEIISDVSGKNNPDYAGVLNNLAILYSDLKRYNDAESLMKEVIDIVKNELGEKHRYYAISLNSLANLYSLSGRYSEAEQLYKEAVKIDVGLFGKKHPTYASDLNNLALLYCDIGRYNEAEPLYKESLRIYTETLGKKHPFYTSTLTNIALLYCALNRYKDAGLLFREASENYLSQLESIFPSLSEQEKMKFLKSIDYNFELLYSYALKLVKDKTGTAFDILRFRLPTKGMILSSTTAVKNRILESGNVELINSYSQFTNIRNEIAFANTLTFLEQKQRGINIDSLEKLSNEIEKQLSEKSEDNKSELEKRKINWTDVQKTMKSDEAAVEFLNFRFYDKRWTDTIYYCALLWRKGFKEPELIQLCTRNELVQLLSIDAERKNSYVNDPDVSNKIFNLIWAPLENELKGIREIYISPSGLLNKISFLSLNSGQDTLISDKYSLHYVGNLKDIIDIKKERPVGKTTEFTPAIFGGALFDLDTETIKANSDKYKTEVKDYYNITEIDTAARDIDGRGSSWNYLRGTLDEANSIKYLFEQKNVKVELYIGKDASEEALKSLSKGKIKDSPAILHIATHGFFFPEPQKEYDRNQLAGREKIRFSENPLLRSGLILAGANYFWNTNKTVEGAENGVLTAYEVSNLNLQNTELVVLSACETGLGDIKGVEGVYGLQRAFKIAGAKTIIMSLWKVPDRETVELMELFYSNWLEKDMTKYAAFTNAQKEMRKKYPPYYWAAFVMVE